MVYNEFKDKKLSALGLGCMRFPTTEDNKIDEAATQEMFDHAIANGINYFDTAWMYHGGQSEIVTGKCLSKYPRDSYYIATKFPGFDTANMEKVEEIFEKQLEKTGMEYFDFYLFHNVSEGNIDGYTDEKYGIFDYLMKQKENGRIKHLGFSAHGNLDTLKRFLEKYGYAMEFGQLQINWLDYIAQNGKEKIELFAKYNIPVWVMEPVRGGRLVSIGEKYEEQLKALRPEESVPGWAFRFIQSIPEVKMTLSGMSNMEQLKDNIKTFAEHKPLNEVEFKTILDIGVDMLKTNTLPCTACAYCVDKCPMELDIPKIIKMYNGNCFTGLKKVNPAVVGSLPEDKRPDACIGCQACEAVCPQNIKISEMMADFAERLK